MKTMLPYAAAMAAFSALLSAPALADDEFMLNGKPCNRVCQDWTGVHTPQPITTAVSAPAGSTHSTKSNRRTPTAPLVAETPQPPSWPDLKIHWPFIAETPQAAATPPSTVPVRHGYGYIRWRTHRTYGTWTAPKPAFVAKATPPSLSPSTIAIVTPAPIANPSPKSYSTLAPSAAALVNRALSPVPAPQSPPPLVAMSSPSAVPTPSGTASPIVDAESAMARQRLAEAFSQVAAPSFDEPHAETIFPAPREGLSFPWPSSAPMRIATLLGVFSIMALSGFASLRFRGRRGGVDG